jgi:hypothetical protein
MTKFIRCDCGHGGLFMQYSKDFGLEISHYLYPNDRSWKNRLRSAWAAIKGRPYADMVVIDDEKLADLVDFLTDAQNVDL